MQPDSTQPLLFQRILRQLFILAKKSRIPLLSALICGFLAHGFVLTNKLINHDEAFCLFSKGGTVVSGRWGLGALDSIFPNVSLPWIYGIITIVLFTAAACVIVRTLELKSSWTQALTGGLLLTFPSLTGTFGYMFTSSSYAVAFLLSTLAVLLIRKDSWFFRVGALICLILSLSIYQAYIAVAACLLILVLIQDCLGNTAPAAVLRKGVGYILFLILSLGLYLAATQVILRIKHIQMVSYAADSVSFNFLALPSSIVLAYRVFFSCLKEGCMGLVPTLFSRRVHILLLICAAVLLVLRLMNLKKDAVSVLLLIFLILLLPLAVNCMYLFTSKDSVHSLVLYSFVCVYLLILVLADGCPSFPENHLQLLARLTLNAVAMLSAVVIVINTYVANESYLTLHLRYENAYAFYSCLIADLRMMPEFTEDTQLAVMGTWDDPDFYEEALGFTNILTGVTGFKPDSYSAESFLKYYLGFSIPFASEEAMSAIAASPEYAEMPCYPYYGSVQRIGEILVVKLS